jgi:hypothetical protein
LDRVGEIWGFHKGFRGRAKRERRFVSIRGKQKAACLRE